MDEVEPDEALLALAADLIEEYGEAAVALAGGPITPRAVATSLTRRWGAWAVHPLLGHHLLTRWAGDTISGTAHQHVPRPLGMPEAVPQGVLTVKQLEESHAAVTRAAAPPAKPDHKKKAPGH